MDDSFARALDEWTAYYALMGGAAATLLGLLFVAVSLRLNIFHQRAVADVRDFAALTLGMFLAAIAVAGATLAPHESRSALALALLAIGAVGLLTVGWISRVSIALNRTSAKPDALHLWHGWPYALLLVGPSVAVIGVAILLWRAHPAALAWLAVAEAWLLGAGTVAAWILLAHAGRDGSAPPSETP